MNYTVRDIPWRARRKARHLVTTALRALTGAGTAFSGHHDQAFGHLTYAQHGEDLVLLNVFHLLGIEKPSYLDVGAHHPINISNTALLYARGSRGVNVEANPNLIEAFRRSRPEDLNLNVGVATSAGKLSFYRIDEASGRNTFDKTIADAFIAANPSFSITDVIEIDTVTINTIVKTHCSSAWPNLLSIDVEGLDYDILVQADFSSRGPDVICVEAVTGAGTDDSARFITMLRAKGYVPYFKTVGNVIFLSGAAANKIGLPA